jgi:uncharacterized protein (DUF1810 family)
MKSPSFGTFIIPTRCRSSLNHTPRSDKSIIKAMSLDRFIKAQEKTYADALAELKAGQKTGHWIWWVFPQMRGLGTSEYSVFYGIVDEAEALTYLQHPVLGARYRECVSVVHGHLCQGRVDPLTLMGSEVDVVKLRSSLGRW